MSTYTKDQKERAAAAVGVADWIEDDESKIRELFTTCGLTGAPETVEEICRAAKATRNAQVLLLSVNLPAYTLFRDTHRGPKRRFNDLYRDPSTSKSALREAEEESGRIYREAFAQWESTIASARQSYQQQLEALTVLCKRESLWVPRSHSTLDYE